jgi:hypothetical protein
MKIKGTTAGYLNSIMDPTDTLHSLTTLLGMLDPVFDSAGNFNYVTNNMGLLTSIVDLNTAMLINSQDWILEVSGYPFYVAVTDVDVSLPEYWLGSVKYDDNGENPTQKTMAEWADERNFTVKEYDDAGTTKYIVGNLSSYLSLDIASQLQVDGWELKTQAEAQEIYNAV